MADTELKLLKSFPGSFISDNGEFVPERSGGACFNLANCESDGEIKCKVLEWCSRAAFKSEPYNKKRDNDKFHEFMLDGINDFLEGMKNCIHKRGSKIYQITHVLYPLFMTGTMIYFLSTEVLQ